MVTPMQDKALANPEFWARIARAADEVRSWPQWMKGHAINARCYKCGDAGVESYTNPICAACSTEFIWTLTNDTI